MNKTTPGRPVGIGSSAYQTSQPTQRHSEIPMLDEPRSHPAEWTTPVYREHPEFASLRERALPILGGYSFANIVRARTVTSHLAGSRFDVLEMISQYFDAVGMREAFEVLQKESGHHYQTSKEHWARTDLHLLTSLGLGHRDNLWDAPVEVTHDYLSEPFEDDFRGKGMGTNVGIIAENYKQWSLTKLDTIMNCDKCSLEELAVIFGTQAESEDDVVKLCLALPMLTSSNKFLELLIEVYRLSKEDKRNPKGSNNVLNFIKVWMGLYAGRRTRKMAKCFLTTIVQEQRTGASSKKTLAEEILETLSGAGQTNVTATVTLSNVNEVKVTNIVFKRGLSFLDVDPLELARQITLIYHKKFAAIPPVEFLIGITNRMTTIETPLLAEFFAFERMFTQLIGEWFVKAQDPSKAFLHLYVLALHLRDLKNLSAVGIIGSILLLDDVYSVVDTKAPPAPLFYKGTDRISQVKKEELLNLWATSGESIKRTSIWKNVTTRGFDYPKAYSGANRLLIDNELAGLEKYYAAINDVCPMIPNLHVEVELVTLLPIFMDRWKQDAKPILSEGKINWKMLNMYAARASMLQQRQTMHYNNFPVSQVQNLVLRGPEMSVDFIDSAIGRLVKRAKNGGRHQSKTD